MRRTISDVSSAEIEFAFRNWRQAEFLKSNSIDTVARLLDCDMGDAIDYLNECQSGQQLRDRLGTEVYTESIEPFSKPEGNVLGSLFMCGMFSMATVCAVLGCVGWLRG